MTIILVPKGAGGYICRLKVTDLGRGRCEIKAEDYVYEDFLFLLRIYDDRVVFPRKVKGIEIHFFKQSNELKLKKEGRWLSLEEAKTYLCVACGFKEAN